MSTTPERLRLPSDADAHLSRESSRLLAAYLSQGDQPCRLQLVGDDHSQVVEIPARALHLLIDILSQMALGNAVTLVPIHAELTSQEAADVLNVSRPFLINLLEAGEIPFRTVGRHRRVRFQDLMGYKRRIDAARCKDLEELVAQAEALDMGY